jgi:hypothetical protein
MKFTPFQNATIIVSSCILFVAAAAKIAAAAGDQQILLSVDPILLVSTRVVLLGVASIEILCLAGLMIAKTLKMKGLILTWLALNFFAYRLARLLSGVGPPCPCLGSLGKILGLSSYGTELVTRFLALCLLFSGLSLLLMSKKTTMAFSVDPSNHKLMLK